MNKIFLYALGAVAIIIVGILIFYAFFKPNADNVNQPPVNFAIIVKDNNYLVYSLVNNKELLLTSDQYLQYVELSFNSPRDLLWMNCANGGQIIVTQPTNNIINDPILGKGIEILSPEEVKIYVQCRS